jgi:transcriptional regulator NrdR family protein
VSACHVCQKGTLRVTNTYRVNDSSKVQRAVCDRCGAVHTVQVLLTVSAVNPKSGKGAFSSANRLRKRA